MQYEYDRQQYGSPLKDRMGIYDLGSMDEPTRKGSIDTFTTHTGNFVLSFLDDRKRKIEDGPMFGKSSFPGEEEAVPSQKPSLTFKQPQEIKVSLGEALVTNSPDAAKYIFDTPEARAAFLTTVRDSVLQHPLVQANPEMLTVSLDLNVPELKLSGKEQLYPETKTN